MREHCQKFVLPAAGFLHLSFGVLLFRNIRHRSHPFPDLAIRFEDGDCSCRDMTVGSIGGQDSKFGFVGGSSRQRMFPYFTDALDIIQMELSHPAVPHHLFFGLACESPPGRRVLDHFPGRAGGPHHLRRSQHKRLVSLFTPAQGSPGRAPFRFGHCQNQAGACGNQREQL